MSTAIFGDIKRMLKVEVVTQLPTIGKSNKLYFVLNGDTAEENRYDEYIWVKDETHPNGYFELVGYKYVDLSPYYTKTEVDNLLSKKVDLTEYNQFKETTNQSITNLETKLDEHIEDFNDQVNNINSLNNTVNSLSNTVVSHDTKFWNLENDTLPELQSTDAQLSQDVTTLTTNLNTEISNRTSQDAVLQANIDAVSSNLNEEVTARTEADSDLQSQITNLTTVVNSKADAGSFKTINGESIEGTGDISIDLTLYRIVSSLPTTDIDNTKIYLVVNTESEPNNEYIEYIYVNNKWEELGKYKAEIDLSPYYTKTEVDAKLDTKLNIIDAEATYVAKEEGKGLSTNDFNNTYKDAITWIEDFNSVSTLVNIPCTKRLVIANIAVSETMSISANIPQGRELHIIIKNTSDTDITITLPTDSGYINLGGNSFIITSFSYAEVNIISKGTIFYVRFIVREQPQDIIMTIDSNPEVMAIMWKNGLCASPNYMLKSEAAAVVDSQLMSGDESTSIFYNKGNIKSFNEFKYFTGITAIPSFRSCKALASIEIPPSVTTIGNIAFYYCNSLTSIVVAEGNTKYDSRDNCNAIIETSSNTLIVGCKGTIIPSSVTSISRYAFGGCTALTSIEIPSSVTSIGDSVFDSCTSLASVKLPTNLTNIGDQAFYKCYALVSVEIPEGVNSISYGMLQECTSLTSIEIPSSVTTISNKAFSGCSALTSIKCLSSTAPTVSSDTFGSSNSNYTGRKTYNQGVNKLIVPEGATGYDEGQFLDPLCNPDKCGFTLYYDTPKYTDPSKAVAADYCLYDKQADKLIIVQNDKLNADDFPLTGYTPVGVVTIPGSHDVYGTGQCGVMSLVEMSYSTPDTGSINHEKFYSGNYGYINVLTNFRYSPYIGINYDVGDSNCTVIGEELYTYIPSDYFYGTQCPHDKNSYYTEDVGQMIDMGMSMRAAPSPYLTDNSRNSSYYQTSSPSSEFNCLSDFGGNANTTALLNLATGQSDWKTSSTITNSSDRGYSPAACCCWRFHTDGTKQGDWYLPAMGELGYIISRLRAINTAILNISTVYNNSYALTIDPEIYDLLSSTVHAYYGGTLGGIFLNRGKVDDDDKQYFYVRAFLRV